MTPMEILARFQGTRFGLAHDLLLKNMENVFAQYVTAAVIEEDKNDAGIILKLQQDSLDKLKKVWDDTAYAWQM